MATAAELLAAAAGAEEKVCVINLDTRQIEIPSSVKTLGVESDDDVKRLYFKMPRIYRGTDLSQFDIRINYMNAANEGDIYVVTDQRRVDDTVTFSWLVGPHALEVKGNVRFIVCMKWVDQDDNDNLKELNTTVASLPVLEGLEVDAAPLEESELPDILQQLSQLRSGAVSMIDESRGIALSMLSDHKDRHIEAIATEGQRVLETIPPDYRTANKLFNTRANAIVNSAEGSVISVSDASDDYLRGLRVFGKSTQVKTTFGKNLFSTNLEYGLWVFSLKTKTNNTSYVKTSELIKVTPGKTYCFSGTAIKDFQGNLAFYDVDGNYTGDDKQIYAFNTFTVPSGVHYIAFHTLATFVKNINGTVQLEEGDIATDYEPYSGGHVSPSPDWAQPIESIENLSVNIHRKNLVRANYDKSDTYEGMSVVITKGLSEVSLNGTTTKSYGYAIAEGTYLTPGQYTMSVYGLNAADYAYLMSMNTRTRVCDNVRTNSPVTFNVTEAGIYRIDFVFANATTYTNATVKFQIESGDKGTDYEPIVPYQSLSIPLTLPGIPVTSSGNYTDENGQQWICDEIDFERGVYVERIGKLHLTGEETGWGAYNYQDTYMGFSLNSILDEEHSRTAGISNQFSTFNQTTSDCIWVGVGNKTIYVISKEWNNKGIDAWKNHLSENPLDIIYPRHTPIETPLTDTELLAAYSALHSNYPTTTVLNDQGAHMEIKYNADTQIVFESAVKPSDDQIQAAVESYLADHPSSVEIKATVVDGVLKLT